MIEFFAPVLLLGAVTRPAALAVGIVMFTAILMAHFQYGFFMNWSWKQKGEGIEYFLLLFGIVSALIVSGGGR